MTRHIAVELTDATMDKLNRMAEREGKTRSTVTEQALRVYAIIDNAMLDGAQILIRQPDGHLKQLHIGT